MDFAFQHEIPGYELPEEWHVLLAEQARTLAALLHRLCTDASQNNAAHVQTLVVDIEQFLAACAQHYVCLERETAQFQAIRVELGAGSLETAWQWPMLDQVTAALHANLTAARRYLTDITQAIEPHTTGA